MTPRHRSIDNTTILRHACDLLAEQGAEALTFAQVAARCGLAPPTLVQRFATREAMLAGVGRAMADALPPIFARAESPLPRLRAALKAAVPLVAGALSLGAGAGLDQFSLSLRKQISFALAEAVEAGELPHCDVAQLARSMQISLLGAVAIARIEQGDASDEVSSAIEGHLANFI